MAQLHFSFAQDPIPNRATDIDLLPPEEWRTVVSLDLPIEVSNHGRLRSYRSRNGVGPLRTEPIYITPRLTKWGYVEYRLSVNGSRKGYRAHRLVATAFLGESTLEINHRDGDKTNNVVTNLEYCTPKENMRHSVDILGNLKGEKHPQAKLTEIQVREIRRLAAQRVLRSEIAQRFGISKNHVSRIKLRQRWR